VAVGADSWRVLGLLLQGRAAPGLLVPADHPRLLAGAGAGEGAGGEPRGEAAFVLGGPRPLVAPQPPSVLLGPADPQLCRALHAVDAHVALTEAAPKAVVDGPVH